MAISTNSYFSNSIIGTPGVGADIDIYESSTNPKYAVGFGFTRADGNKYRYCHLGAISNRGTLISTDVSESNLPKGSGINAGALVANVTKRAGETLNPNVVGARYMQLVITATADQFAGAYINIVSGAGAGFTYRITGNTADTADNPVDGNIYMDLNDSIQVAIDSTSDLVIAGSAYANVEGATTTDRVAIGVTVTNNSATSWGWVQSAGIIGVLQDVIIGGVGRQLYLSSNTTGAVMSVPTGLNSNVDYTILGFPLVGYIVEPGSSADYTLAYLTLE